METSGADHVREAPEAPPPPEPAPPPEAPPPVAEHHGFLGGIGKVVGGVVDHGLLKDVGRITAGVGDQLGKLIGPTGDLAKSLEHGLSHPDAPATAPPAPETDWQGKFAQAEAAGRQVEATERHAEQLLQSPSPADQLRGQEEMQRAQQMMENVSKAMQAQSDAAKGAVKDLK
jgi:hypothetical protein